MKNKIFYLYVLAILIPLIFISSLHWNPNNPAWSNHTKMDIYFGADSVRVIENLKDLTGSENFTHYRDKVHPYFSLFAVTISKGGQLVGVDNLEFIIYRNIFGTLGVFLFWLFIYKQTNAMQAFSAVALLLSTMSFRVWMSVPETYIFSFFTMMLAINLIRINQKVEYVLLASMAGTITNISLAVGYATAKLKSITEVKQTLIAAVGIALIMSVIQQNIYPSSVHFFDIFQLKEEAGYVNKSLHAIFFRVFDFFVSGFILPLPKSLEFPLSSQGFWNEFYSGILNTPKQLTLLVGISIFLLITLYSISIFSFVRSKDKKIGSFILFYIGSELLLHLIYGETPFFYSLNFLPFIIIFISIYTTEKFKFANPILLLTLAVIIQRIMFIDFGLFEKYFV